jgi:hypothetical protein
LAGLDDMVGRRTRAHRPRASKSMELEEVRGRGSMDSFVCTVLSAQLVILGCSSVESRHFDFTANTALFSAIAKHLAPSVLGKYGFRSQSGSKQIIRKYFEG